VTESRNWRGVFGALGQLVTAIDEYVHSHNEIQSPSWTAGASDSLEKVTTTTLHFITIKFNGGQQ
jgi:hypothetical protein